MKQEEMTPLKRLFSMLKPDNAEIRNVYIFAAFSGAVGLGLPIGIQAIVNFIQMGRVSTSWIVLVVLVMLAILISGLLNIAQMRITENLQQRIFVRSALDFTDRIPLIETESLTKQYAPELPNRFFDTITIQKGLSKLILDFAAASLQIVFGLILLSFYHSFFIFFGIALLLLLFLIFRITTEKGFRSSLRESNYKYKIAHWLQQIAYTRFSFKMAGTPSYLMHRTDTYLMEYLRSRNEHFKILRQQYLYLIGFKSIIAMALLVIGGLLVINQTMNIGQFVAAEIIILLILSSVERLIVSLETVYDLLTAIEKIGQVTDLTLEHKEGIEIPESEAGFSIQFDAVTYHNDLTNEKVLNHFSLSIEPNSIVLLDADNTVSVNVLFCMLGGIYHPSAGSVSLNQIPIGNLNREFIRNRIGNMLSQDLIVHATLLENITLGRTYVSFGEVQEVCEALLLTRDIQSLREGFNTLLNPEGHFLSKACIRKILLARALVGFPKLVLLEEPFHDIPINERPQVLSVLKNRPNCTLLIQSNDETLRGLALQSIVVQNGIRIA
ncbi:MAG: ATP-binding cassette domain-containing protein [Flavobacteriales bacterium]